MKRKIYCVEMNWCFLPMGKKWKMSFYSDNNLDFLLHSRGNCNHKYMPINTLVMQGKETFASFQNFLGWKSLRQGKGKEKKFLSEKCFLFSYKIRSTDLEIKVAHF